jgi:hypothetical protein
VVARLVVRFKGYEGMAAIARDRDDRPGRAEVDAEAHACF